LNLMINAADAIKACGPGHAGQLTITTSAVDGFIRLHFQDNGAGIAAEHLPLIFDPFFTTKKPGQGTGLGLAVSFMIVEALGGRMAAYSKPGQGTTLELELPLADTDGDCRKVGGGGG
jgi:two-component system NtrC family sensor kinase